MQEKRKFYSLATRSAVYTSRDLLRQGSDFFFVSSGSSSRLSALLISRAANEASHKGIFVLLEQQLANALKSQSHTVENLHDWNVNISP